MKKLFALLMSVAMTGCIMNPPAHNAVPATKSPELDAQAKLAEKLPLVTPDSITADNAAAKGRELQAELDRAAKNLAAARVASDQPK